MKFIIATSIFALMAVCVSSIHPKIKHFYPNCPKSEFFNITKTECKVQVFGAEAAAKEGLHYKDMDPAQMQAMKACMSGKLEFNIFGTISVDDVDKIMATMAMTTDEIRTAMKAAITECITEHNGAGKEILHCIFDAKDKHCV